MTAYPDIAAPGWMGNASCAARQRECTDAQAQTDAQAHWIAERLQGVLLRTHHPKTLPGLTIEAFYEAILSEAVVGGDSFDIFPLTGGRIALVVADASGKGLEAAERVAEIRFALRAFLREHGDPEIALSCLNDFVCDAQRLGHRDDSTFATLTLALIDSASGVTSCLCAGGEPPLVLRVDGTTEIVSISGAALGLFPQQGYTAAAVRLGPGDAVLLVTDGLTEARPLTTGGSDSSRVGPFLGLEGLARLATEAQISTGPPSTGPLSQIGRVVFDGARAFADGIFHDDACLLLGRRDPGR